MPEDISQNPTSKKEPLIDPRPEVNPELAIDEKLISEGVMEAINKLSEQEQIVIRGRFGFNGSQRTYDDIGKEIGISGDTVERIERESLPKLKKELNPKDEEPYISAGQKYINGAVNALYDNDPARALDNTTKASTFYTPVDKDYITVTELHQKAQKLAQEKEELKLKEEKPTTISAEGPKQDDLIQPPQDENKTLPQRSINYIKKLFGI
jgi:hypothetical protein